jgi:hypothetical protein
MTSVWDTSALKVYQVEVTNHCDARCSYCPHSRHQRKRGFITGETFSCVLDVATNRVMSMHHFGEPLLHRGLERLVSMASGRGFTVGFSTHGRGLTQERLNALVDAGLSYLRLHTDPFGVRLSTFSIPPSLLATEHRLLVKSDAPKKELQSYAGFVDVEGEDLSRSARCSFLVDGWRAVCWDGSVALCCNDVEATGSLDLCRRCAGYVFDSPLDWGDYDGERRAL